MNTADGILLGVSYVALVLVLGVCAFWVYLNPCPFDYRSVPRLVGVGLALAAVTAIGQLFVVMREAHTGPLGAVASRAGTALLVRLALTALLAAWVWQLRLRAALADGEASGSPPPRPSSGAPVQRPLGQRPVPEPSAAAARAPAARGRPEFDQVLASGPDWWPEPEPVYTQPEPTPAQRETPFGAVLLVLFAGTWVLAGRSAVGYYPGIKAPLAVLHLLAMSVWLGAVVSLAIILLPTVDTTQLEEALPKISAAVFASIATVAVTGVVIAGAEAHGRPAVSHSDYGTILLAKIVATAVMLLIGALGRRYANGRLTDILVGVSTPLRVVFLAVGTELVLGGLVLALSAGLPFASI